ncbi:hypothetical protein HELRODRAFT_138458, partial [Helobdella robusta]|uniref:Kringle domain-containing protein n=1 Tax=Helobdella robusta TaxID=6412 RepID=T1EIV0_HELRO
NGRGYVYTGNVSTTIFGRTCQRWDSQEPHEHNQDVAEYFMDVSMNTTENKCRNPTNPFIPRNCWCYTMDAKQRREYCDVPFC